MAELKEADIQASIQDEFKLDPFVAWSMVTTTGKTKMAGGFWVTLGVPGVPDIIGQLTNGIMFGYEVKRPDEKPTSIQAEFITMMIENNGECGWGCSPLDAVKWLGEVKLRYAPKPKAKPKAKSKKGSRLNEDWELPDDWYQWANENRPDIDVSLEADKFKDYWLSKPGAGAIKTDWLRTWRNWVRSAFPTRRTGNETHKRTSQSQSKDEWLDKELF